jgi:ketosteroid isomerase-like protein
MTRKVLFIILSSCIALLGSTCARAEEPEPKPDIESEIRSVLRAQEEAWNRGDIDAFMDGYWRSDKTVFVSGDEVSRGWEKVLDRYKKRYSDPSKMGTLTFADLEITALSDDSAVVLGRWELQRKKDRPRGRFTLIFRRLPEGWKIVHDHTSAAEQ